MLSLFDSHCHLCDKRFASDFEATVARAAAAGVTRLLNVAYDLPSAGTAIQQAVATPGMYASVGLHPHEAKSWSDRTPGEIVELSKRPGVVALGEMGLDFFRNLSARDQQIRAFEAQLDLAVRRGLPVIVHDREAHDDVLSLLREAASRGVGGVVHCFTGDWQVAQQFLDLGFYLGLTGLATYRSTPELTEVAKNVPADRLLLETDCPYLTPQKHRNKWKRNEPSLLPAVAEFVAEARGEQLEAVAEQTFHNTCELFRLDSETPDSGAQVSSPAPRVTTAAPAPPPFDERTLKLLELDKVIEHLADRAATDLGAERCRSLKPVPDPPVVEARLAETSEAKAALEAGERFSFGGLRDIREALRRAQKGLVLSPPELLEVASTLAACRGLHGALVVSPAADHPRLQRLAANITPLPEVEEEIDRCIDPEALVRDTASPKLRALRRRLVSLDREAHRKLNQLLASDEVRKMLQEPLATVRGDRFCVPVRAEFRSRFDGLLHDQSASGATLFMEPRALVDLGNQLRQTQAEEREEVHRVLAALTNRVASHRDSVRESLRAASILDFIVAKARLSLDWHSSAPRVSEQPVCDLVHARHPLLGEAAVPIDVHFGDEYTVLLITGPNTGGKTVTLKTVGLLCLMAACGLHVPARHNSRVPLFSRLCVDIGDEQSLEQNLSTFSSHLHNIVSFLDTADESTLVLLDEIGVGTDPNEGAALAKAILRRLKRQGARVLATTHYSELKNFAFAEAGVENACVEFNPDTLQPTYRLLVGLAGSSNAFVISERLGLPAELVREARESLAGQQAATAELLRKMESRQRELDQEWEAARRQREEAERLRREHEEELAQSRREREQTRDEAVAAASELLTEARTEAEAILRTLRQQSREGKPTQVALDRLKGLQQEVRKAEEPAEPVEIPVLLPGQRVSIPRFRQEGVVLTSPNAQAKLTVRTDTATVELFAADVVLLPDEDKHREPQSLTNLRLAKSHVPMERNVIGMTVDQAVPELDKYLDDAALAGLQSVRIIHGRGTGALRTGVHEFLREHAHVARFELADMNQGGDGATIVHLHRL